MNLLTLLRDKLWCRPLLDDFVWVSTVDGHTARLKASFELAVGRREVSQLWFTYPEGGTYRHGLAAMVDHSVKDVKLRFRITGLQLIVTTTTDL